MCPAESVAAHGRRGVPDLGASSTRRPSQTSQMAYAPSPNALNSQTCRSLPSEVDIDLELAVGVTNAIKNSVRLPASASQCHRQSDVREATSQGCAVSRARVQSIQPKAACRAWACGKWSSFPAETGSWFTKQAPSGPMPRARVIWSQSLEMTRGSRYSPNQVIRAVHVRDSNPEPQCCETPPVLKLLKHPPLAAESSEDTRTEGRSDWNSRSSPCRDLPASTVCSALAMVTAAKPISRMRVDLYCRLGLLDKNSPDQSAPVSCSSGMNITGCCSEDAGEDVQLAESFDSATCRDQNRWEEPSSSSWMSSLATVLSSPPRRPASTHPLQPSPAPPTQIRGDLHESDKDVLDDTSHAGLFLLTGGYF